MQMHQFSFQLHGSFKSMCLDSVLVESKVIMKT